MRCLGFIRTAACAALLFAALPPRPVRADDFNDRTIVKFSNAVRVPGTVLPAGTYVFKVLETSADRIVVQISNEAESHTFATLIAVPDVYMTPQARRFDPLAPSYDETHMTFYESAPGQPEALKTWYYPGANMGREFVYSKSEKELIERAGH
jgi:hypothetical protein